jgi:transposase, IS6 family
VRWYWKHPSISRSWRGNETYANAKGRWASLYRAVDKEGNTIDIYLSPTRNAKAAKRFLSKAINGLKDWEKPLEINTDKAHSYEKAIAQPKDEGKCLKETIHRQVKYLNNVVEADHSKLKRVKKPTLGFKSMKTAYATLKGFEVMHALRKGEANLWFYGQGIKVNKPTLETTGKIYGV